MSKDFYQTLGVSKNASADEIKKAYRKLAMKHHPDRNPDKAEAEGKFKEVQKAYEILSDEQKRGAYDQYGHAAFEAGGGQDFGGQGGFGGFNDFNDFGDLFSNFFGGGARSGRSRAQKGDDVSYSIEITLEQAAFGHVKAIKIPLWKDCNDCDGTGAQKGTKVETCGHCNGSGTLNVRQGMFVMQQTCPYCQGSGKHIAKPCKTCHGAGKVRDSKELEINIPAGIESGMRIRSSGYGDPGSSGGPNGDLYIEVNIQEHDTFERNERDLHCTVPIPFTIAALGNTVRVPTLGGGHVELNIPEGTQNGQSFRLRGKGIKGLRTDVIGDLYVHISIETPVKLNAQQKALLQQFSDSLGSDTSTVHSPKTKGFMDKLKDFFD